jgi:hypothetical protein
VATKISHPIDESDAAVTNTSAGDRVHSQPPAMPPGTISRLRIA